MGGADQVAIWCKKKAAIKPFKWPASMGAVIQKCPQLITVAQDNHALPARLKRHI
jgi:hypothetical protein